MNQAIIASMPSAPMQMPVTRPGKRKVRVPKPAVRFPARGTTGPVHISTSLNPILEICHHPDRDRLLAEYFSRQSKC